jgi:hypothetical protein
VSDPAPQRREPSLIAQGASGARARQRKRQTNDGRWAIWFGMLILGLVVGVAFYQLLPIVTMTFDGWLTPRLR